MWTTEIPVQEIVQRQPKIADQSSFAQNENLAT